MTRFSRSLHFWSRISQKRCILGTNLLKNTNRKWYTIYRMIPVSMTLSDFRPQFQGHDIFRHWISLKLHEIEPIESHMRSIAWWHFQWPRRTHNPVFKSISKTVNLRTMFLQNTNRKPYTIYRMIPLSVTLSDLWPRFQGHNIFWHWISQKQLEIEP